MQVTITVCVCVCVQVCASVRTQVYVYVLHHMNATVMLALLTLLWIPDLTSFLAFLL